MTGESVDTAIWRLDNLNHELDAAAWAMKKQGSFNLNLLSGSIIGGFGNLPSTFRGTRKDLSRLLTRQLTGFSASGLPAAQAGADADSDDGFDQDPAAEQASAVASQLKGVIAAGVKPAAANKAPDATGGKSAHLLAAADSALASAAADIAGSNDTTAAAAAAAAAEMPQSNSIERSPSSSLSAVLPLTGMPSVVSSSMVPKRLSSRTSSMRALPRNTTLKRMETSNAWWELHDMELEDKEEPEPGKDIEKVAAKASKAKSGGSMSKTIVRAIGSITAGTWRSALTNKVASFFGSATDYTPVYSQYIKKTVHETLSTDGWTLHLVHSTDTSLAAHQRKNHPILMCPGLASSGAGTWDLLPKVSLVDYLAAAGYDVWYIDIRGNGRADKQSRVDIDDQWNIDDYLVQDVPACVDYVLKYTKADMFHWMGHSMGGMLGSGLCSQAGKWSRRMRSVMLVASGCFGDGSWHCLLKKLIPAATCITTFGFPAHITTQGLALLANTPAALSVFETLFYWCPNMEKPTRKVLLNQCFNFIPQRLVEQFLASHDSPTGLSNTTGTFLYADPDMLAACKVPALGMNGDWDLFCPAAGGAKNIDLFAGPKKHITFGPANGHQHHYGHFDIICGKNAPSEVWPHIQDWLDQHDSKVSAQDLWDDTQ